MTMHSIHDLAPQLAANRQFWCGWAGTSPDADLPMYRTDFGNALLNGVLRVHGRPLDEAVTEVKDRLAGSRWVWWVGADSDAGTAEGLVARGAVRVGGMPVMAVDVTTVADPEPPAELKIWPVTEPADMKAYVAAYAGPLGIEGDLAPVVERELDFGHRDVVRLAGIVNGRTVGTCTLSLSDDVGALYCIATDPEFRRRGIATALTVEALRIVRETGRRFATLQASEAGEPVYRDIGFETVSTYELFTFPA
jgi:ribosomal protein S18 acetylase RimI-like enzyme